MDLELTADQFELRDNIRTVLAGSCPPSVVRGVYEGTGTAEELWAQMVELYWPALGVTEAAGGVGLGFVEVGLLAEELGRVAAPGPLLATISQVVPALTACDASVLLAEVARGERIGALAYAEGGRWHPNGVHAQATRAAGQWSLTGTKGAVLGGASADSLIVVAREGRALGVFMVDARDVEITVSDVLDPGLGLADIRFEAAPATPLAAPADSVEDMLERVTQHATVAMALHMVGACRRIFEETLDYAKVREQFGRPIGSFQALKHRFADMFLAVERANAVGYYAALSIAEDDPARAEAVHVAKAAAGDCQRLLAEDGLQLHGGIGFTWENDLHFLLKRAKAGDVLCGTRAFHRAALAQRLDLVPVRAGEGVTS